jgi:hypothetical protein
LAGVFSGLGLGHPFTGIGRPLTAGLLVENNAIRIDLKAALPFNPGLLSTTGQQQDQKDRWPYPFP